MEEKKVTSEGKEGEEDKGKRPKDSKEWIGEGAVKKMKRGLKALREIIKYQTGTKLLIRRLPFQRVVKEIV